MHAPRRIRRWLAGAVVIVVAALFALPFFFRGPIERRIKAELAARVDAQVDWRRADLAVLRDFPSVTLRLHELTVVGTGPFAADTLLSLADFRLVLDAGSVLRSALGKGTVVVRSVALQQPDVRLRVLPDGTSNWDIVRPTAAGTKTSGAGLELSLEQRAITDGRIAFENRRAGLVASLSGLQNSLRGDFRKQRFTIRTHSVADSASVQFAGVPYLHDVRLELAADVDADLEHRLFTIRNNQLRLNALSLVTQGSVAAPDSSLRLDLSFDAPAADFRALLSLVPALYARSFATLQASGTVTVNGWVRGTWGRDSFPALALRARVANGSFRYPDLPLPARDIGFDLAITNPGGHADSTVARLEPFHLVLGNDRVDGSFGMRTPVSDPEVDFRLQGRVDLANLRRTIALERVQQLSGVVVADASMRARLSDVDARRYDRIAAAGTVALSGFALSGADLRQPVQIERALLRFTPRTVELPELRGRLGTSDFQATGALDNLLGFALRHEALRGQASVRSVRFDLNEWRSNDELKSIAVPARVDLALQAAADTVRFGQLTLLNARGTVRVLDRRATLADLRLDLLGGALVASGWYETVDPARPTFDVDLGFTDLDIPAAFGGLRTVQAFAPVAQYAQGRVSAQLELNGALGTDMLPLFNVLSGIGTLATSGLVLRDFPPLDHLSDLLQVPQLQDPGFVDLRSAFEIKAGRLFVKPFDVQTGQLRMNVSGSNGIDKSLDYNIDLQLPRSTLGTEANRAIASIVARSSRAGIDLQAADVITLRVGLTGTVTKPSLLVDLREATAGGVKTVEQALQQEAQQRTDAVAAKLDSTAIEARRRAAEEAARIMTAAEEQADAIRTAAKALAERTRQEANTRADSLEARATSPVAKMAATAAAARIRREADLRANA
ncbi:MAG: hypothetical protein FIB01_13465, partial [Gemmatimonadetes bacterium]|nr:hypothetical protein [Gemmatimonadota bacterium]